MKFYQLAKMEGGKIVYDRQRVQNMLDILYDGTYLVSFQRIAPKSTLKELRAAYFAKIDILAYETGHSKYEMHDLVKDNTLRSLVKELPELYEQPKFRKDVSTMGLTDKGWIALLERLDLWAFTEYNIILQ